MNLNLSLFFFSLSRFFCLSCNHCSCSCFTLMMVNCLVLPVLPFLLRLLIASTNLFFLSNLPLCSSYPPTMLTPPPSLLLYCSSFSSFLILFFTTNAFSFLSQIHKQNIIFSCFSFIALFIYLLIFIFIHLFLPNLQASIILIIYFDLTFI